MTTVATKVIEVHHETDPKKVIWDALDKWLPKIQDVTGGDAVVCIYERPAHKVMRGPNGEEIKFDMSQTSRNAEDKFQGVVGLLVKVGPHFEEKCQDKLGVVPKVGDWVTFRNQDCFSFVLGERSMRQLEGQMIRKILTDPDAII
jgi:hypothetical protein